MSGFKKYLESRGLSKGTVELYYNQALDFIAWLDRANVEAEAAAANDVTGYLMHLQKRGQVNFTRSIHLIIIRHFFNWQIERGLRTSNPAQHIKIRGAKHKTLYPILSMSELEKLHSDYLIPGDDPHKPHPYKSRNWFNRFVLSKRRNKAMLSIMIHQGVTTAEADRLRLTDLKLREGSVEISGSRKSNARKLELKPQQIMELMEYVYQTREELLKYCQGEVENLFISVPPVGKKMVEDPKTNSVWRPLTKELKSQHPRFINFKQVRASMITHWLGLYNLREVQYMAGHRYISSTEAYQVNQLEDLQADVERYHPL